MAKGVPQIWDSETQICDTPIGHYPRLPVADLAPDLVPDLVPHSRCKRMIVALVHCTQAYFTGFFVGFGCATHDCEEVLPMDPHATSQSAEHLVIVF